MQNFSVSLQNTRIKPKFFLRDLNLNINDKAVLSKARSKRIYFKSINIKFFQSNNTTKLDSKTLSFVTKLELSPRDQMPHIDIIKKAKNLRTFHYEVDRGDIEPFIKRLPQNLKIFKFCGYDDLTAQSARLIYQNVALLLNLRVLCRSISLEDQAFEEENDIVTKCLSRLSRLENFEYDIHSKNRVAFYSSLKQSCRYPYVTSLSLTISGDYSPVFRIILSKEMIFDPFFRYDLFPNLRKLDLIFDDKCFYPLTPKVIEGFKAAQKLEQVSISFGSRILSLTNLFEGLLHLPLLKSFKLSIPFLHNSDKISLNDFLKKQTDLVFLSLKVFRHETTQMSYVEQNQFLENIWRCLDNKPQLKYLQLESEYWPIDSLSSSLQQVPMINQLQELKIEAFDNIFTPQTSPLEYIQGLCHLIRQQKQSLRHLSVNLGFVIDGDIVNSLLDTISELEGLRVLDFEINVGGEGCWDNSALFLEQIFADFYINEFTQEKFHLNEFFSRLSKILPMFKKLSSLNLSIETITETQESFLDKFLKLLKVLASMESLRCLDLTIPIKDLDEETKERIIVVLRKFITVKQLVVRTLYEEEDIELVCYEVQERTALRSDLMF